MKKNQYLIEQAKQIEQYKKNLKRDVVELYSAMLIMYKRRGHTDEECAQFIYDISELWNEVANDDSKNMYQMCLDETGFDIHEVVT